MTLPSRRALVAVLLAAAALLAAVVVLEQRDEAPLPDTPASATPPSAAQIERGRYLALAGNCAACHTARGGSPYAGGPGLATPFGTVFASNLTPHLQTGIGAWTPAHFWQALHHGRSRDGRLLYPAFPYPSYTQVTRQDADALFAYLGSLPAVAKTNRPHALRFPYDSQFALRVWRALFFTPGVYQADTGKSAEWNRGAYLVRGLGHCVACHAERNALGATSEKLELSGGLIPMQNWYAPALGSPAEAGVADWELPHVVELLKTGRAPRASVQGPMAEVVYLSTQHLSQPDLQAIAVFLKALPQTPARPAHKPIERDAAQLARGAKLYEQHCADCHGDSGQGAAPAYPTLAGNRAVTLFSPANLIHVVLGGGFAPATAGNPRPYGMPPFLQVLSDADIAAVLSHIRASWGNEAEPVSAVQVLRLRGGE